MEKVELDVVELENYRKTLLKRLEKTMTRCRVAKNGDLSFAVVTYLREAHAAATWDWQFREPVSYALGAFGVVLDAWKNDIGTTPFRQLCSEVVELAKTLIDTSAQPVMEGVEAAITALETKSREFRGD